ncbi:hypothetical protein ACT3CD_03075 [Geofilum sp. OHC36d9]|uniref:hypothetical protein n=1 Tax=Geofilum sp. OHC36d9 TaxID=3458413 RepID=UPI004034316A
MIDEALTNDFLELVEENKKLIFKVSHIYCDSTILFVITYIANIFGPKSYRNRIAKLEKEVLNLKEYLEE